MPTHNQEVSRILKFLPETLPSTRKFRKQFCGELLGYGIQRNVYEFLPDSRYVAKIANDRDRSNFANIMEHENWVNAYLTPLQKWLAPIVMVGSTGMVLIQRKVIYKTIDKYPKKMPSVLGDFKITNYGWIGSRIVACDYSYLHIGVRWGMVNVKWWDLKEI